MRQTSAPPAPMPESVRTHGYFVEHFASLAAKQPDAPVVFDLGGKLFLHDEWHGASGFVTIGLGDRLAPAEVTKLAAGQGKPEALPIQWFARQARDGQGGEGTTPENPANPFVFYGDDHAFHGHLETVLPTSEHPFVTVVLVPAPLTEGEMNAVIAEATRLRVAEIAAGRVATAAKFLNPPGQQAANKASFAGLPEGVNDPDPALPSSVRRSGYFTGQYEAMVTAGHADAPVVFEMGGEFYAHDEWHAASEFDTIGLGDHLVPIEIERLAGGSGNTTGNPEVRTVAFFLQNSRDGHMDGPQAVEPPASQKNPVLFFGTDRRFHGHLETLAPTPERAFAIIRLDPAILTETEIEVVRAEAGKVRAEQADAQEADQPAMGM